MAECVRKTHENSALSHYVVNVVHNETNYNDILKWFFTVSIHMY